MSPIGRWISDAIPSLLLLVATVALVSLVKIAWRSRDGSWRAAARATLADSLLLLSLGAIVLLTVGTRSVGPQPDRVNLLPFRDQIWALQGTVDPTLAVAMLIGNVLLFIPLGVALAARRSTLGPWTLVGICAVVSLAVEGTQAAMNAGRLADVTDLVANTAGGTLGVFAWRALRADRGVGPGPLAGG